MKELDDITVDYYRPRILENFVRDIMKMAENDKESPNTRNDRLSRKTSLVNVHEILKESHKAAIHRFNRVTTAIIAGETKRSGYVKPIMTLILASMLSSKNESVCAYLDRKEVDFFVYTVGAVYPVWKYSYSYTLYELWLVEALAKMFKE